MKNRAKLFPLLIATVLLAAAPAFAGGPLVVFEPTGTPIVYDTTGTFTAFPVPFNPDLGGLGTLSNAEAVAFTEELFQTWQNIPTSTDEVVKVRMEEMDGVDEVAIVRSDAFRDSR